MWPSCQRSREAEAACRHAAGERGATLPELLVASAVTLVVAGAAGVLADGLQRIAVGVEVGQAARMDAAFTLAEIVRLIEQAGSFPYGPPSSACVGAGPVAGLVLDPAGTGRAEAVRVRMDVAPPNGLLGGVPPACGEAGEDVTLAFDRVAGTVTRLDGTSAGAPVPISAPGIIDLVFALEDADGRPVARAADAQRVRVTVTVRGDGRGDPRPRVHQAVARLRER